MSEFEDRQSHVLRLLIAGLGTVIVLLLGALFGLAGILYNSSMGQINDLQKSVNGLQIQQSADSKLVQSQLSDMRVSIQDVKSRTENLVEAWNKRK